MNNCTNGLGKATNLTNGELTLIKTIRSINDPDQLAQISNELSNPDLRISFLLIAADLINGAAE